MIKRQYTFSQPSRYYTYDTKNFDNIKSMDELCSLFLGVFKIKDILYMQQIEIAKDICKAIKKRNKNIKMINSTEYISKGE